MSDQTIKRKFIFQSALDDNFPQPLEQGESLSTLNSGWSFHQWACNFRGPPFYDAQVSFWALPSSGECRLPISPTIRNLTRCEFNNRINSRKSSLSRSNIGLDIHTTQRVQRTKPFHWRTRPPVGNIVAFFFEWNLPSYFDHEEFSQNQPGWAILCS